MQELTNGVDLQERDINDVFCDILLTEDHIVRDSYIEGYEIGRRQGNVEAFHLGYHRGAEIGAEIGFYVSVTDSYLNSYSQKQTAGNEKLLKELIALKSALARFPTHNDSDIDILALIDEVRVKFKKLTMPTSKCHIMLKQHIDNVLDFMHPFLSIANCHMVDFFTSCAYVRCLPIELQKEISEVGESQVINLIFANDFSKTPNLKKFVDTSSKYTLRNCEDYCMSSEMLRQKFIKWGCDSFGKYKLEVFMSAKKSHEVEILSAITASLVKISNVSHLIDIGDGKGYLSSFLALHYGIPVLGIDASNVNTSAAIKRAAKLSKAWNGLAHTPKRSQPSKDDHSHNANLNLYRQTTCHIDENLDLQKLFLEQYQPDSMLSRLGLIGLHTCGNLSSNSLKIFSKTNGVITICNVGCCYHLLTEQFENPCESKNNEFGFPLSDYFQSKKIMIGRTARMIANQSVDRVLQDKELPNITIYYRAVLQVLLDNYYARNPKKHVGRFKKQPASFLEYAKTALKRIDPSINLSEQIICTLYSQYESRNNEINIFYLIRCKLAPVIESLILFDRLLFLYEQGFENSFIVQLFNPVISPRCYGIVALKDIKE